MCQLTLDSGVMAPNPLHLGVALAGYGWHPQAWRQTLAGDPVTSGRYWARQAGIAEHAMLDFLTMDDTLDPRRPGPDSTPSSSPLVSRLRRAASG